MLPSTRPRTASEASPAVTRPSPLRSRPLFHWYSMLPLDHRVELGSDFGEPYSTEVYTPSSVDRLPLPAPARSMKYCSTYCSCSTELICANAAVLVPRPAAVFGMNWIRPVAPLPALLACAGAKLPPVSKLITAIRYSGLVPSRAAMASPSLMNPRSEEHTSELQSLMRISIAVFCSTQKTIQ